MTLLVSYIDALSSYEFFNNSPNIITFWLSQGDGMRTLSPEGTARFDRDIVNENFISANTTIIWGNRRNPSSQMDDSLRHFSSGFAQFQNASRAPRNNRAVRYDATWGDITTLNTSAPTVFEEYKPMYDIYKKEEHVGYVEKSGFNDFAKKEKAYAR